MGYDIYNNSIVLVHTFTWVWGMFSKCIAYLFSKYLVILPFSYTYAIKTVRYFHRDFAVVVKIRMVTSELESNTQ